MEPPSPNPIPTDRRRLTLCAVAVAILTTATLLATSPGLPIVWDEGNAIGRAERIGQWTESLFHQTPPGRPHPLSRAGIAEGWPYTTQIEGHPAFYGLVIAAGQTIGGWLLSPLTAWRLGPMLLFALAAGAMFYRMGRDYGQAAGWAAAAALLLQPRLFAHAHFATCDGPLTACWILAWAAFPRPVPKDEDEKKQTWLGLAWQAGLFGMLLGMTMSTKATGWIAPIPFVLWAAIYRDRRAMFIAGAGAGLALATFWLLNPPLWHSPGQGLATFFQMNMNRQLNVANFFMGRMYDLHHPLPWYNTIVWTAVAVPVGLLLLALFGLGSILRRGLGDRAGILLVLNWLILLVVRAIPGTPPHDGIRLFLPAFAFLAGLVGVGVAALCATACLPSSVSLPKPNGDEKHCLASKQWHTAWWHIGWLRRQAEAWTPTKRQAKAWTPTCVVLLFLGSGTSLVCYAPQWLSYYNLLIGGLPGATRAGMEPTYFWDSLDANAFAWLAANTKQGEKVWFGSGSDESLALMREWGTLPVEYRPEAPGRYRWYVIQRRPSACMPPDQWLLSNCQPVYKKYLPSYGPGPWRMNVPLLEVYRFEDFAAATNAVQPK